MNTYTGKEYMQIEIAGMYGLDKEIFPVRIAWVEEHEDTLESMEDTAKDYYGYCASVMAYRKAQKGIPSGYLVSLDATASGIQLLSVLTGCKIGAANSGVTGQLRVDPYKTATEIMNGILGTSTVYERETIKSSLMKHYYNSKAEPKNAFGEDTPELSAFYQAAAEIAPGAEMIMPIINSLQDPDTLFYDWDYPDGFQVHYKVKDVYEHRVHVDTLEKELTFAYQYTVNTPMEKIRFLPSGIIHGLDGYIVRELTARCDHSKGVLKTAELELIRRLKRDIEVSPMAYLYCERMWHKHKALSIVGIEYVNSWSVNQMSKEYCIGLLALIRVILKRPSFKVIGIHDCFKNLPNYMDWTRQTYIDLLAEIADSSILDAILSDIAGYAISVPKLSSDLSKSIRLTEYPLA